MFRKKIWTEGFKDEIKTVIVQKENMNGRFQRLDKNCSERVYELEGPKTRIESLEEDWPPAALSAQEGSDAPSI